MFATREVDGEVGEYGVAIRLVLTVSATALEGALTIPIVAAQAQLNRVTASARMSVLGFRDIRVGRLLPAFDILDVQGYGKYTKAADDIRAYIATHGQSIDPVLLRKVPSPPAAEDDYFGTAVGSARALRMIARGKSQGDALRDIPSKFESLRAGVQQTYSRLLPDTPLTERPQDHDAMDIADRWAAWIE
jgi:hypothetical protein